MLLLSVAVSFFSFKRCGHCQRLTPEWKKAATALKVSDFSQVCFCGSGIKSSCLSFGLET